jgi:hypothetical protein
MKRSIYYLTKQYCILVLVLFTPLDSNNKINCALSAPSNGAIWDELSEQY